MSSAAALGAALLGVGDCGAALLQPPKSSSALTVGFAVTPSNPPGPPKPPAPPAPLPVVAEFQPPKSSDANEGATAAATGGDFGHVVGDLSFARGPTGGAGVGSEVAHASLLPQGLSMAENLLLLEICGCG